MMGKFFIKYDPVFTDIKLGTCCRRVREAWLTPSQWTIEMAFNPLFWGKIVTWCCFEGDAFGNFALPARVCLFSAGAKRTVTLTGRATVVAAAKRDADKPADDDCVIYRYGSFCTGIEVFGELPSVRAACVAREPLETVVGDRPPIFVAFQRALRKWR